MKFQARVGDRIYIVGGIDDSNNPQPETWYAQKGGTRWNILDNTLRKPRYKLACVEHKGKLWAIGGAGPKPRPEDIVNGDLKSILRIVYSLFLRYKGLH